MTTYRGIHMAALGIAIALSSNACGSDGAFIDAYAGEPYLGSVRVVVTDAGGTVMRRRGEGSAQFEATGRGQARLVVYGAIENKDGDAGFAITGAYGPDGWTAEEGGVRLHIGPDGRILGGGVVDDNRYSFSGSVSPGRMRLTVELTPQAAAAQPASAANVFTFNYRLSRDRPEAAMAQRSGDGEGKCRSIRYEMRPVASIGDGTMSMLRVPVCLK
ncbi:hypothetical protein LDO26_14845 [Luteimonas sp. BDR2-5]|uniref:hypothetical protein n=1 Tax=Proluteimonas luteida TaxID=2878685 RepID=UPI001E54D535|nr:hypothetical protein [Luteimonas sp. BDR2-5]MCD9029470.1 hypothetical protein [Luteimonas sp. BDR2-5]